MPSRWEKPAFVGSLWYQDNDPKPRVRLQMYGKDRERKRNSKTPPTWRPWWLGTKSRAYLRSQPGAHYEEFWVDVYEEDILFVLQHPLLDGRMDPRDENEILRLWGNSINILTILGGQTMKKMDTHPLHRVGEHVARATHGYSFKRMSVHPQTPQRTQEESA